MSDERRHSVQLTDEQINEIAERAAEKAIEAVTAHVYQSIGRGVVSKVFTIAGMLTVAAYFIAREKGWLPH